MHNNIFKEMKFVQRWKRLSSTLHAAHVVISGLCFLLKAPDTSSYTVAQTVPLLDYGRIGGHWKLQEHARTAPIPLEGHKALDKK